MFDQTLIERANGLAAAGRVDEAATLLDRAGAGGNADALYHLAFWRISGQLIRRDLPEARRLMGAAGEAGRPDALLLYAHFLANGTGGETDWPRALGILSQLSGQYAYAAEQRELLGKMDLDDDGCPTRLATLKRLGEGPQAHTAPAFLTAQECDYLVRQASPRLQPSTIIDRATGRAFPHPVRRSEGTIFGVTTEDLVVSAINRRIAALTGTKPEQGEALEVISYGPGGEFRPHFDALEETDNQRIITVILYLTDRYQGGETRFVRTGLSYRGRIGDAILFRNSLADGRPDPLSEHAGVPVLSGRKTIATRWIRASRPVFPPPEPLSKTF